MTLHPSTRDGCVAQGSAITSRLAVGALSSHASPGADGFNLEFYAVLTQARDARLVIVVADTDEYPGAMGISHDGVHVLQDGVLKDPADAS